MHWLAQSLIKFKWHWIPFKLHKEVRHKMHTNILTTKQNIHMVYVTLIFLDTRSPSQPHIKRDMFATVRNLILTSRLYSRLLFPSFYFFVFCTGNEFLMCSCVFLEDAVLQLTIWQIAVILCPSYCFLEITTLTQKWTY